MENNKLAEILYRAASFLTGLLAEYLGKKKKCPHCNKQI